MNTEKATADLINTPLERELLDYPLVASARASKVRATRRILVIQGMALQPLEIE